jgi:hypothetical protein
MDISFRYLLMPLLIVTNTIAVMPDLSPVSASIATSSLLVLPIPLIRLREVRLLLPALGSLLALPVCSPGKSCALDTELAITVTPDDYTQTWDSLGCRYCH